MPPRRRDAVNTLAFVAASIAVLAVLAVAADIFWLAVYNVPTPRPAPPHPLQRRAAFLLEGPEAEEPFYTAHAILPSADDISISGTEWHAAAGLMEDGSERELPAPCLHCLAVPKTSVQACASQDSLAGPRSTATWRTFPVSSCCRLSGLPAACRPGGPPQAPKPLQQLAPHSAQRPVLPGRCSRRLPRSWRRCGRWRLRSPPSSGWQVQELPTEVIRPTDPKSDHVIVHCCVQLV